MSESLPLSFDDLLKVTPISPGRRQKQGWNADNKVSATKESKGHRRTETSKDTRTAWASSGLGDDDIFRSSNYKGPRPYRTEEDPLAGELMNCKESVKHNTTCNTDMNRHDLLQYKDIRLGAVRKSSPERLGRRTKSPEPSRKSNTWAASGTDDRGYDKPWLTHSKKPKPKSPDEPEHARPAVTSPKSHRVHSARPHTAQTSSSPRSQAQQTLSSPRSHVKQTHSSPRTMSESLPLSFDDLLKVTPISPG
ncbi:unnamed protein product [Mytilus coruscus]|uniref:Uncharacterized protein n=1 Tax=Mytilus coruscus TaxID=42192 RepID=A0A6J8CDQ0_MYTCO|nr:unnamed protein product [Mytilus coruscus]